jgi:hypothetical protein
MPPLALTDSELDQIMAAATPIDPDRRDSFLRAVASELARCPEVGPGSFQFARLLRSRPSGVRGPVLCAAPCSCHHEACSARSAWPHPGKACLSV